MVGRRRKFCDFKPLKQPGRLHTNLTSHTLNTVKTHFVGTPWLRLSTKLRTILVQLQAGCKKPNKYKYIQGWSRKHTIGDNRSIYY